MWLLRLAFVFLDIYQQTKQKRIRSSNNKQTAKHLKLCFVWQIIPSFRIEYLYLFLCTRMDLSDCG